MATTGKIESHKPSYEPESDPNRTCLYDGERWPCNSVVIKDQVIAAVLKIVKPSGEEPRCCDIHSCVYDIRIDLAEEIKEL